MSSLDISSLVEPRFALLPQHTVAFTHVGDSDRKRLALDAELSTMHPCDFCFECGLDLASLDQHYHELHELCTCGAVRWYFVIPTEDPLPMSSSAIGAEPTTALAASTLTPEPSEGSSVDGFSSVSPPATRRSSSSHLSRSTQDSIPLFSSAVEKWSFHSSPSHKRTFPESLLHPRTQASPIPEIALASKEITIISGPFCSDYALSYSRDQAVKALDNMFVPLCGRYPDIECYSVEPDRKYSPRSVGNLLLHARIAEESSNLPVSCLYKADPMSLLTPPMSPQPVVKRKAKATKNMKKARHIRKEKYRVGKGNGML